jgi:hypothetical protein
VSPVSPFWDIVIHVIDCISSLTTDEFINFVGHYHALAGSQTSVDDGTLIAKGYSPEAIAELRKQVTKRSAGLKSLGLHFIASLTNFKSDIMNYSLMLFQNYERGVLPFPGSFSEQPAQIIEIFGVLQALKWEREQINRKKNEPNVRNKHKNKPRGR